MVLSDKTVQELISKGRLFFQPPPDASSWQAMTVTGTLGNQFFAIKDRETSGMSVSIDLGDYKSRAFLEDYMEAQRVAEDGSYVIRPKDFILAYTREKIGLPNDSKVCAFVEGRSGLARIGLGVHVTAPIIHCGFGADSSGPQPIMLEMFNYSRNNIILRPGVEICQFMFFQIDKVCTSAGGKTFSAKQVGSENVRYLAAGSRR